MQQFIHIEQTYKCFFLYCGFGGAALGAQQAEVDFRGVKGRFEVLGGVDSDLSACKDFEMWTGVPATCMDLFDEEQYREWHGKDAPATWREATPDDIRAAAKGEDPDMVVVTAPCKGFSGLLSEEKSKSTKYQALNKLTIRGIYLTLETWKHNPPPFILFENVPRIATRGKQRFISLIKKILRDYGYVLDDRHHDCGVLGGLGQHRKRYLLIARLQSRVTSYCYNPPDQRVKSIGEIIDNLPMPDDQTAGPLHRLPRLQWKTWMRLALIPPGGDWRNLQHIEHGRYRITQEMNGQHTSKYRVYDSTRPAGTVTGSDRLGSGAPSVADVRLPDAEGRHNMKWRVQPSEEAAATVLGQTDVQAGAPIVSDPRIGHTPMGKGKGAFWVQDSDGPSGTVTADPSHRKSGGASVVADPRLDHTPRDASMKVGDFEKPAGPIVGHAAVTSSNGIGAVADPRLSNHGKKYAGSPGLMGVGDSEKPSHAVTGSASVSGSNTTAAIADPNYTRTPRSGVYEVQDMERPSGTVTGGKDPNGNMLSVADPKGMAHASTYGNMLHITDGAEPAQTVTGATGPNQGAGLIADPRFGCEARNGTMGVMDWEQSGTTVTANGDVHAGTACVADPRGDHIPGPGKMIPADNERGTWVIVSPHTDSKGRHCWHRPLTTLELLALQSFPTANLDGSPILLDGNSDRSWRERIGNAVPPKTMKAITEQVLLSLIPSDEGIWRPDVFASGTWVVPPIVEEVKGA